MKKFEEEMMKERRGWLLCLNDLGASVVPTLVVAHGIDQIFKFINCNDCHEKHFFSLSARTQKN